MQLLKPLFLLPIGLAAFLAPAAIAQPVCYVIDASGRMTDLSKMCGKSTSSPAPTSNTPASPPMETRQVEQQVEFCADSTFPQMGVSDAGDVCLDPRSIRRGSPNEFELVVFQPNQARGTRILYRYKCPSTATGVRAWTFANGRITSTLPINRTQRLNSQSILANAMRYVCKDQGTF